METAVVWLEREAPNPNQETTDDISR